ncbi:amphi-Trp domain-containing protein [Alteribacillus iranensis]|uniref:Amphi-Trp domain-containing protein n=1 Tax=Alteribacillus iranensis TaxID=930128 RepID=A0A1I2EMH2_9BACI|nr:amphi-Trp domain-containing protein [Alteribacillus iranensis]SFE93807.1 amphi-Trp domain-containing protein [Alteribacillus iranensis]
MFGQERLGKDVRFEDEEELRLKDAAEKLETLASMLRSKGECRVANQEGETTITPAENVQLQIEYIKQGKEYQTAFILSWKEKE